MTDVRFIAPKPGDTVSVKLSADLVRAVRAAHDEYPGAANHLLADRAQVLLDAGHTSVDAECVRLRSDARTLDAGQLLWLRCEALTGDARELVVFTAGDCELTPA